MRDEGKAEFLRVGGITRLDRLTDGRVLCCICFAYRRPEDLYVDDSGQKWDFCPGQCAEDAGHFGRSITDDGSAP